MHADPELKSAATLLRERLGGLRPETGIILGSGLGNLGDRIDNPVVVPFIDIPGFPVTTAIGHKGNFICGTVGGKCIIAAQGRYHYYEAHTYETVTLPLRLMIELGIRTLITTNASGALNPEYDLGDLMVLTSHINFLEGYRENNDRTESCSMYDESLRKEFIETAENLGIEIREGCYVATTGPSYETPAEHFNFIRMGGDAIGMSTIPEVQEANKAGLRTLGISIVADAPHYEEDPTTSCLVRTGDMIDGDEVVKIAEESANRLMDIIEEMLKRQ